MDGDTADEASNLPRYLREIFDQLPRGGPRDHASLSSSLLNTPDGPSLQDIGQLPTRRQQYAYLLLARHRLTQRLSQHGTGLPPQLILARAAVYEALGYSELALADAYVSYTLCLVALEGSDISDLEPTDLNGNPWPADDDDGDEEGGSGGQGSAIALAHKYHSLILMCRAAIILGAQQQAKVWIDDLLELKELLKGVVLEGNPSRPYVGQDTDVVDDFCNFSTVYDDEDQFRQCVSVLRRNPKPSIFGSSQRQVYPWNEHEPNRMSKRALEEINDRLHGAAPDLEVEISTLPNLSSSVEDDLARLSLAEQGAKGSRAPESCSQLGLFAKKDLAPGTTILEERSVLTAIRPHGEALCDACAADMESIPRDHRKYCAGCNIPFCSEDCHSAATRTYHRSNYENYESDEGYPPAEAPFCPGASGNEDIHTLGRAESSTTPEWDLYFLLLSRTLQMAETQNVHPLDLFEIKYLWGDFSPTPDITDLPRHGGPKTLPYSVRHHVELPLQWFEIFMHSREQCRPYSAQWLEKYDWWIIQTLFAKFRGVADAQQSTWTGKPEVAAVHPLWCLANHSCNPNVTWKPSGVRNLTVMKERVSSLVSSSEAGSGVGDEWKGIKAGEEIWNHYTDIHEKDYRERRERLRGVLGGDCKCERCTTESR